MSVSGQQLPFKCPLCGSDGYVTVIVQKPNGHWYRTAFYQCFGCSVTFVDPEKFARQERYLRRHGPPAAPGRG